jgi:hypothetical protein
MHSARTMLKRVAAEGADTDSARREIPAVVRLRPVQRLETGTCDWISDC